MLDRLPLELVACIGAAAEYPTLVSLSGVCRGTHAPALWDLVAKLQWGVEFWTRALNRPTLRRFKNMQDELAQIHRLQERSRAHNLPVWSKRDYFVFWEYERRSSTFLRASHHSKCCGA